MGNGRFSGNLFREWPERPYSNFVPRSSFLTSIGRRYSWNRKFGTQEVVKCQISNVKKKKDYVADVSSLGASWERILETTRFKNMSVTGSESSVYISKQNLLIAWLHYTVNYRSRCNHVDNQKEFDATLVRNECNFMIQLRTPIEKKLDRSLVLLLK